MIKFLHCQLSFLILKQWSTSLCRSDDCSKESSSGMFSRQKSCLQYDTIHLESCRRMLMNRHPALQNYATVISADTLSLSDPILPKSSMPCGTVQSQQACNQNLFALPHWWSDWSPTSTRLSYYCCNNCYKGAHGCFDKSPKTWLLPALAASSTWKNSLAKLPLPCPSSSFLVAMHKVPFPSAAFPLQAVSATLWERLLSHQTSP